VATQLDKKLLAYTKIISNAIMRQKWSYITGLKTEWFPGQTFAKTHSYLKNEWKATIDTAYISCIEKQKKAVAEEGNE
jgi:hypothetical protein